MTMMFSAIQHRHLFADVVVALCMKKKKKYGKSTQKKEENCAWM